MISYRTQRRLARNRQRRAFRNVWRASIAATRKQRAIERTWERHADAWARFVETVGVESDAT